MKIKYRKAKYKSGDYLVKSDFSDRIALRSESVKLWNNLIVNKDEYEIRNPQDFIKARPEREPFKEVRPRAEEFLTDPVTADDL